MNECKVEGGV